MSNYSGLSRFSPTDQKRVPVWLVLALVILLGSCQVKPQVLDNQPLVEDERIPEGMTADQVSTLASLKQIDEFPLYTMAYEGDLALEGENAALQRYGEEPAWACSLFAAYGDPDEMLYGRNFDWDFSPALLLFMDPPGGYASVSMGIYTVLDSVKTGLLV